jgi:predicted transcriptional regulator of viral defense system
MSKEKPVYFMMTIPKIYRDKLRTMAAQANLINTDKVTSAAEIARQILCEGISMLETKQEIKTIEKNERM